MRYLLDTNILLRFSEPQDPNYQDIRTAMGKIAAAGHECFVVPQNLIEFWASATRPYIANGLQMDEKLAHQVLLRIKSLFEIKHDTEEVYDEWERLVVRYQVAGRITYDARLVASMIVHRLDVLLTLDKWDFARYREITAIDPSDV